MPPIRNVFFAVQQIIAERLGVEEGRVRPEADLVDDFGVDSLGRADLVLAFEEAFEINILGEEASKMSTVLDAFVAVQKRMRDGAQSSAAGPEAY